MGSPFAEMSLALMPSEMCARAFKFRALDEPHQGKGIARGLKLHHFKSGRRIGTKGGVGFLCGAGNGRQPSAWQQSEEIHFAVMCVFMGSFFSTSRI